MVDLGRLYSWKSLSGEFKTGIAIARSKYNTVVLRDSDKELWIIPEDELMEVKE